MEALGHLLLSLNYIVMILYDPLSDTLQKADLLPELSENIHGSLRIFMFNSQLLSIYRLFTKPLMMRIPLALKFIWGFILSDSM